MESLPLASEQLSDSVMNCGAFKKAFADIYNSRLFESKYPKHGDVKFATIGYSAEEDVFFSILASTDNIIAQPLYQGTQKLNKEGFLSLYSSYHECFISIDRIVSSENYNQSQQVWDKLFSTFLYPLLNRDNVMKRLFICLDFKDENTNYIIDLTNIYNLKFRYYFQPSNEYLHITTVTFSTIFKFLQRLSHISFPIAQNAVLLYGLDRESVNQEDSTINAAVRVFKSLFPLVTEAGGKVVFLTDLEQLKILFEKNASPCFIQLIAHFHERRIFIQGNRSIGFHLLESTLEEMKASDSLRGDIALDAITCNNYLFFSRLYEKGIQYLHMSHNNLSTELAAAMLFELYSGVNAHRLGWEFPYLNGKTYLHEAFGNVSRCFYTNTLLGRPNLTFK